MNAQKVIIVLIFIGLTLVLSEVSAISPPIVVHRIDSTEVVLDSIPPSRPMFNLKSVHRDTSFTDDAFSSITFAVHCEDDRSQSFEIGYKLTFVDGTLPDNLQLPQEARRTLGCGGMGSFKDCLFVLFWYYDKTEPFEFRFYAVAIDKAGNVSVPSDTIRVLHDGID